MSEGEETKTKWNGKHLLETADITAERKNSERFDRFIVQLSIKLNCKIDLMAAFRLCLYVTCRDGIDVVVVFHNYYLIQLERRCQTRRYIFFLCAFSCR